MTAIQYAVSDTFVLAKRSLKRIRCQPDLLVSFTIQPIMFVLLFVYVFGGAIDTGALDYVDFLMPGIIVQSMVFGGFVTALGLAEDLKKGLIDRFRSLPMWSPAVVSGRILADVGTNVIQLVIMFAVGIAAGFRFNASLAEIVAGLALLLLIGYAFSWVFAFIGLSASSPEASRAYGFTILFPVTFVSSAFVPPDTMPNWLQPIAEYNPVYDHGRRDARAVRGHRGRQRHLGRGRLVGRDHRRVRRALGLALPPRGGPGLEGDSSSPSQARVTRSTMTGRGSSGWSSHQRVSPTIALRSSSAMGSSSRRGIESSGWARRSSARTPRAATCTSPRKA